MYTGKPPAGDRPLKTLERVISKAGLGSRTEARSWIGNGRVAVNGRIVQDPGAWIDLERDEVSVDGRPLETAGRIYVLLHKPAGYVTTYRDPEKRPTVYDLLPDRDRYLFPVGRLDLETSGLLMMTNDTQFAELLTNPAFHVPKTYDVTANVELTDEQLDLLRQGIELKDGPTRPARVRRIGASRFEITITEGRNRQVRRMVEALGGEVRKLIRIAIGPVGIGDLAEGSVRALRPDELRALRPGRKK